MSFIEGSPEWFYDQAQKPEYKEYTKGLNELRLKFIDQFSPEKLAQMSGNELLTKVFSNNGNSMMELLNNNKKYRQLGAGGRDYSRIVYYKKGTGWVYIKRISTPVTSKEAEEKAKEAISLLIDAVDIIKLHQPLTTLEDYLSLEKDLKEIYFYKNVWTLKYFQMLFVDDFPEMYAVKTIQRAGEKILGLPLLDDTEANKFKNQSMIAVFMKRCNLNAIEFNNVFSKQWGWDEDKPPCKAAKSNTTYITGGSTSVDAISEELESISNEIEERIDLEGIEREAVVKVRVNQSVFRDYLLHRYDKCCLCGVQSKDFLTASHIKPWSDSNSKEKIDIDNGFLMCPAHDKLFDKGFISFDDDGKIIISDKLNYSDGMFLNVHENMKIDNLTEGNKEYLEYHRNNVFLQ